MRETDYQTKLKELEKAENDIKNRLQALLRIPELFPNQSKEWLNEEVNQGLDQLKVIWLKRKLLLAKQQSENL